MRTAPSSAWAQQGRVFIQASHNLGVMHGPMKLRITVDQKTYEVDVEVAEDDRAPGGQPHAYIHAGAPTALPSAPPPPPRAAGARQPGCEDKVCRSPVSGVVVRVTAQAGQQIQANDLLLVLEAMKMETNITSPRGRQSQSHQGRGGRRRAGGQVLVEFE